MLLQTGRWMRLQTLLRWSLLDVIGWGNGASRPFSFVLLVSSRVTFVVNAIVVVTVSFGCVVLG